jgi:aspartyl/asparaginyl-tRNA synthetase
LYMRLRLSLRGWANCAIALCRYVQFCLKFVLENCMEDLKFFEERVDPECITRCEQVAQTPFVRLSYTDAITLLMDHEVGDSRSPILRQLRPR